MAEETLEYGWGLGDSVPRNSTYSLDYAQRGGVAAQSVIEKQYGFTPELTVYKRTITVSDWEEVTD